MAEIVFDNISRNYKVPVKNGGYLRYLMRREYKVIEAVKRAFLLEYRMARLWG